jgi:hypothetical protein
MWSITYDRERRFGRNHKKRNAELSAECGLYGSRKVTTTMVARGMELLGHLDTALGTNWREAFVHITFGAFIGGLALLLILLYAGVPIVGS